MIFDRVDIGGVNRSAQVIEGAAGKSVNVARVLAALGEDVMASGFIGGDRGEFLLRELERCGIAHDFVTVRPRTRQCVTVIDRATRTHTELIEESAAVEAEGWEALLAKIPMLLKGAKLVALSGSLPPQAPVDFYRHCARMAREADVGAIVDAAGESLMKALEERPLLVKPNASELAISLGARVDSEAELGAAMRQLLERGAQRVVVTMGADGAVALDGRAFWRVRVPPVTAVNSIGSGDAFTAALAAALARGEELPEALRLGAACGAANAMTLLAGEVHMEDVHSLLPRISVQPM